MSWYDVWSTHFCGKNFKKNIARVYFLWGKQKARITKSRRTHPLHKISSKNPDFEAIYHFRGDSYHTLPWSQTFFLIFLFFLQSSEDESPLVFTASWLPRSSLMRRKIKENLCDQGNYTSAEERSIPLYSSFIMLKFQQKRTKPQVIRFVFSYLIQL